MSVLGFAGAELGVTAELASASGITIDATVVHGGRYSFRCSAGGSGALVFAERSTPIYFRGYFRYPAGLAALTRILEWRDGAGTALVGIELRHDTLTLQAVGWTGAGFGTTPMVPDVWHRVEVLVHQAANVTEIRVNRRQEIVSTTLGIPAAVGQVALMSSSGNVYWDDIHVTEDGWPGPGFVIARQGRPGTGTYDSFTKTGGTIDVIWSETPSNVATNAASTDAGQTQTMLVEALSQIPIAAKYGAQRIAARDTILGAKIYASGRRVGGGPDHYLVRATSGVLTRYGPYNFTTLDTYRGTEMFSATLAQLDAMEIGGARGTVTSVSNLVLNDLWLVVSYTAAPVSLPHFTGFETGSVLEFSGSTGNLAIDGAPSPVRTGVYSMKGVGPSTIFVMHPNPIDASQLWMRGYVYLTALPAVGDVIASLRDANGLAVTVTLRATGSARLTVGGTIINTVGPAFVVNAWNYVEVFKRASIVPGDGIATLWVNDQMLTLPLVDTGGATTQAFWEVRGTMTLWFDDLAFSETGRIGPGRVIARQGQPGVPANDGWTEVGGTIDTVWSNTPSNPATYAQSTLGTSQTMLVNAQANGGEYITPTDTIIACRVVAMARYDAGVSGGPTMLRYRGGGLATRDTSVPITSTVPRLVSGEVFATLPTILNAIQIGGRQGLSGPSLMRIEDIWLMVMYADLQILDLPLPSTPAPVAIVEIEL